MIHLIIGEKNEIRRWIRRQERASGEVIRYFLIPFTSETTVCFFKEKDDQPRHRMIVYRRVKEGA